MCRTLEGASSAAGVELCMRHLEHLFSELADYRPLELLRSHAHRADYMLIKQVLTLYSSL